MKIRSMVGTGLQPIQWLLTDDWRPPAALWNPEAWMLENVTQLWLVRSDRLRLPFYKPAPVSNHSSMAELWQMLANEEPAS